MEKEIELVPFLKRVLDRTTINYKEDFQQDMARLQQAAKDANEDRIFYWMARPTGTWMVTERDAFLRGSPGHTIWTHYSDMPEGINAYRIVVSGMKDDDTPTGTVRKLNYPEQVKRVEAHAIPAVRVEITFESGQRREVPAEKYQDEREWLFTEYGMTKYVHYCPEDETELACVLAAEHRCQKRPQPKSAKKRPQPGAR